jgi:transposase-like protein
VHRDDRVVSVAAILAIGVNAEGRREVLGLDVGPSEAFGGAAVHRTPAFSASPLWTEFLRKLVRRGLTGVEPSSPMPTRASRPRSPACCPHAQAHGAKSGRRLIAAFIGAAFAQETPEAACREWRRVSDRIREKLPKLSQRME